MKRRSHSLSPILLLLFLTSQISHISCTGDDAVVYRHIQPNYMQLGIYATNDSISFELPTNAHNEIKSFNVISENGKYYIAFYDRKSQSVNIYDFNQRELIKQISLEKCLHNRKMYKTTAFFKNFDTILINNNLSLYILDTSGIIRDSIPFQIDPYPALSDFENTSPAILQDNYLFAEARPRLSYTDFTLLKKWKVIYRFDLKENKTQLFYNLPKTYQENIYSYRFFYPSFCFNNNNRFVFSFQADTTIYETDLKDYHIAYFAKSQDQQETIKPASEEEIQTGEGIQTTFLFSDSYSAIYFDPLNKRYLRVAERKISKKDYREKKWNKEHSIIIFDQGFKIIGESKIDRNISLSSLFILPNGTIYARVRPDDSKSLHFVKLNYGYNTPEYKKLAEK